MKVKIQKEKLVRFMEVVNIKSYPIADYKIYSNYREIKNVVDALYHYIDYLEKEQVTTTNKNYYTLLLEQEEKIAKIAIKFETAIEYDYQKALANCKKRSVSSHDKVGEEAFNLL